MCADETPLVFIGTGVTAHILLKGKEWKENEVFKYYYKWKNTVITKWHQMNTLKWKLIKRINEKGKRKENEINHPNS